MTRAQEKTAIGKFLDYCSKFDKRILNIDYGKVLISRIDMYNIKLTLHYRNHTYEMKYNIKELIPQVNYGKDFVA